MTQKLIDMTNQTVSSLHYVGVVRQVCREKMTEMQICVNKLLVIAVNSKPRHCHIPDLTNGLKIHAFRFRGIKTKVEILGKLVTDAEQVSHSCGRRCN